MYLEDVRIQTYGHGMIYDNVQVWVILVEHTLNYRLRNLPIFCNMA